jgi:hypothetical protein
MRIGEECADQSRTFLQPPKGADGLGLEVGFAGDAGLADAVVLDVLPDPLSRFAIVQGSLDKPVRARRLSAGRVCSGWSYGLRGCGHVAPRETGRRRRCGQGHLSQMVALTSVPDGELWRSFPEANRDDILGLLGMLLERLAVSAGLAAEGTGGEHGASA